MNLQETFDFLNFWINKYTGAWYTFQELEMVIDRGQMSLFNDLQIQYATSQRVKDGLAPFRQTVQFTPATSPNGLITISSLSNEPYISLLDLRIEYTDASGRDNFVSVKMYNEDELSFRLMSQIDPLTEEFPIGEVVSKGVFQLYPATGYTGRVTYLRRPVKPNAVPDPNQSGGRVIVIDEDASTQVEWLENWQNAVLIKALSSIGINLGEQDIMQYAELKSQSNFVSKNMV
jgi:hypothetical protein